VGNLAEASLRAFRRGRPATSYTLVSWLDRSASLAMTLQLNVTLVDNQKSRYTLFELNAFILYFNQQINLYIYYFTLEYLRFSLYTLY
jgi:hypothetical protein